MNPRDPVTEEVRRRQRSRALLTALALGGFVVLLYLITIVRVGAQ